MGERQKADLLQKIELCRQDLEEPPSDSEGGEAKERVEPEVPFTCG